VQPLSRSASLPLGAAAAFLLLPASSGCRSGPPEEGRIRVATFNIRELGTAALTELGPDGVGSDPQARAAAAIVRRVRPDILVLNEIDLDESHLADPARNARRFADHYLKPGPDGIAYPFAFAGPSNSGLLSGLDLNGDGRVATDADRGTREHGEDAFGFGTYPGQYSMAVLSRFPLDSAAARTFQRFRWRDLPGNHLPPDFYTPEAERALRLSSKSHWDVPVAIGSDTLHLWVSHPTPPGFDGPEDRNGRRNSDEIRFWRLYLEGDARLVDDAGRTGGYGSTRPFVVAGDLNARPGDTAVAYGGVGAVDQLLQSSRIRDPLATAGPTAVFYGGIRIDYVLPSESLETLGGGVFWPSPDADPEGAALADSASDHRLVWLDIAWPPADP